MKGAIGWLVSSVVVMSTVACSFSRPADESPDGGIPGPMEGEVDIALDTAAKMIMDAVMSGTYVSTAGGPSGSIEPVAWMAGRLLAEYDDIGGSYDGTWASRPTNPADFTGRNVMTMPMADVPRGAQKRLHRLVLRRDAVH